MRQSVPVGQEGVNKLLVRLRCLSATREDRTRYLARGRTSPP